MRKYAFDAIISRSAPDLRRRIQEEQPGPGSGSQVSNQAASNTRGRGTENDARYWPLLISTKLESEDGNFWEISKLLLSWAGKWTWVHTSLNPNLWVEAITICCLVTRLEFSEACGQNFVFVLWCTGTHCWLKSNFLNEALFDLRASSRQITRQTSESSLYYPQSIAANPVSLLWSY